MIGGNETGYIDSDFLPQAEREGSDTYINGAPHTKRECELMYVCKWHGSPAEGT